MKKTNKPDLDEDGFKNVSYEDLNTMRRLRIRFMKHGDRLAMLIEQNCWSLPVFQSISAMSQIMHDEDAATLGLLQGIGIRRMISGPSLALKQGMSLGISNIRSKWCLASMILLYGP